MFSPFSRQKRCLSPCVHSTELSSSRKQSLNNVQDSADWHRVRVVPLTQSAQSRTTRNSEQIQWRCTRKQLNYLKKENQDPHFSNLSIEHNRKILGEVNNLVIIYDDLAWSSPMIRIAFRTCNSCRNIFKIWFYESF